MELIKSTKSREEMLKFLGDTATASSEVDVENFLKIFHPTDDRDQMGKIYEEQLGYNPVAHFDIQDIIKAVDDVLDGARISSDASKIIVAKKDAIVDRAYAIFDSEREMQLRKCLAKAFSYFLDKSDAMAAAFYLTGEYVQRDDPFEEDDEDEEDGDDLTAEMAELDSDSHHELDPVEIEGDDDDEFDFGDPANVDEDDDD